MASPGLPCTHLCNRSQTLKGCSAQQRSVSSGKWGDMLHVVVS